MQSSPPTRAFPRPSSPTGSQYSLDLGRLDIDSNGSSPIAKQKIDRVLSEDIDGPSDFTLNMEKWMRGGTMGKGTVRGTKGVLASLKEQDGKLEGDAQDEHAGSPTSDHQEDDLLHDEPTESHHTPSNSPPRESVWSDRTQKQGEHASSEWDPYGEASTPAPPVHKQLLQPTVEDYHSELTPAHLPAASASQRRGRASVRSAPRALSHTQSEPSSPGRASSPTLSPVRSPVIQRSMRSNPGHTDTLDEELQRLQAKCQQLEHLNSALKHALDEEQRIRSREKALHEAQMAQATDQQRDSAELKEEACKRTETLKAESDARADRLRMLELHAGRHGDELAALREKHATKVHDMEAEMSRQKAEHEQKLRVVNADLEQARRSRDNAEEMTRVHREELDEYRDSHDAELESLRLELEKAETERVKASKLEDLLKTAIIEKTKLQAAKTANENATAVVRAELAEIKQTHDEETTRTTQGQRRAVELAEGLQKNINELQNQLRDRQAEHEAEIQRLQTLHANNTELDDLQTDREAQQSLLNDAILERDAAQDSLTALQSEIDAFKLKLEDSDAVNQALDARISDAMRRREVYWRTKLEASEQERQIMAKALLHQWGREEVGTEEPQEFAFKYLTSMPQHRSLA